MRVAVTGVRGQLVTSLLERGRLAGHEVVPIGRPLLDLADPDTILPAVASAKPQLIIAAAAYTAVDQAELEPTRAKIINADGAGKVAQAAARIGIPIIHISTDYVFDGLKPSPYVETDPTTPRTAYGASKLEGEIRVSAVATDSVILRVGWLYSPFGRNFLRTMLDFAATRERVRVVADQHGGPTCALDAADAILRIGERMLMDTSLTLRGIFHLSPQGEASWADLAGRIFAAAGSPCEVDRISTAEYPTLAVRPANSRLSSDKLRRVYGVGLPHWTESIDTCIGRLGAGAPGGCEATKVVN